MSLKAIAFDAYGTLIDTGTGSVEATREILKKCCSSLDPKALYMEWKMIHQRIIAESTVFIKESEVFRRGLNELLTKHAIIASSNDDLVETMLHTLGTRVAFVDSIPAIESLRNRFKIVIASNTDTVPLQADLKRNGIYYDWLFTSESLKCYKPHQQFYMSILEATDVSPDQMIFVGDSMEHDVLAPKASGIQSIWVNRKGFVTKDEVIEISSLQELKTVLDKIT